jgi:hypothetical protein
MVGKSMNPCCFKNVKYYANNKALMTTIFMEFLTILDVSIGLLGRNTLLFVDSYAVHSYKT